MAPSPFQLEGFCTWPVRVLGDMPAENRPNGALNNRPGVMRARFFVETWRGTTSGARRGTCTSCDGGGTTIRPTAPRPTSVSDDGSGRVPQQYPSLWNNVEPRDTSGCPGESAAAALAPCAFGQHQWPFDSILRAGARGSRCGSGAPVELGAVPAATRRFAALRRSRAEPYTRPLSLPGHRSPDIPAQRCFREPLRSRFRAWQI